MNTEEVVKDIEMQLAIAGDHETEWCYQTSDMDSLLRLITTLFEKDIPISISVITNCGSYGYIIGCHYSPWLPKLKQNVDCNNIIINYFKKLPPLELDIEEQTLGIVPPPPVE